MFSRLSERSRQRLRTITVILATALVIAPAAALAGHHFNDVPDSNVFHDDIEWMRANGVTAGCNPPTNDEYCPDDNVTREQMAAFMHRLDSENVFLRPGEAPDGSGGDAETLDGKDSTDFLGANEQSADSDKLDGKDSTEFAGRLFAVVNSDGTLARGSDAVSGSVNHTPGTGNYEVTFDRDVTGCAYVASIGTADSGNAGSGSIGVSPRRRNPNGVFVDTEDLNDNDADIPFHLIVMC